MQSSLDPLTGRYGACCPSSKEFQASCFGPLASLLTIVNFSDHFVVQAEQSVRCVSSLRVCGLRSELRKVLFFTPSVCGFLFVYDISREPLNGFAPNLHGRQTCLVPRRDEFEGHSQRSRLPGTKTAFFGLFGRPMYGLSLVRHI